MGFSLTNFLQDNIPHDLDKNNTSVQTPPVQAPIQNNWGQQSGKGSASGAGINQASPQPLHGIDNGYFAQPSSGNQTPQPMGKGGVQSNSATSGQPRMGRQNQYSNTVGQWDNNQIQPIQRQGGKGKGG